MKSKEQIEKELARLRADARFSYPPANVFSNAPLALAQVELAARVNALTWVLLDMEDSAIEKAVEQMRAPDFGDARRKWEDTPGQFEPGDEDLFKPTQSG